MDENLQNFAILSTAVTAEKNQKFAILEFDCNQV